jgi:hypothetical protein
MYRSSLLFMAGQQRVEQLRPVTKIRELPPISLDSDLSDRRQ